MDEVDETIELRLSPELFRSCIIGSIGFFLCGAVGEASSIYLRYLDEQPGRPLNLFPIFASVFIAAMLFAFGKTWHVRIRPSGVEVQCLFVSRRWSWQDFQQAEAGNLQIYFPHLSAWKRYLNIGLSESTAAEKAWKTLLVHVPPPEKWNGPFTIWRGPLEKLTFMDKGIRERRLFRERFLSWNELERAFVFRSHSCSRGFRKLRFVFPWRAFQLEKFPTLRGRGNNPADYGVVDFLATRLAKDKLVYCTLSKPAASLEEVKERKRDLARRKWLGLFSGLGMAAYICFFFGKLFYKLLIDWQMMRNYWVAIVVAAVVMLLGAILYAAVAILIWRESRKAEEPLDSDAKTLLSGLNPEERPKA
jgi:low affinity Fe/Cu permease